MVLLRKMIFTLIRGSHANEALELNFTIAMLGKKFPQTISGLMKTFRARTGISGSNYTGKLLRLAGLIFSVT